MNRKPKALLTHNVLSLQRQALVRYNTMPSIASKEFSACIFYWFIPLFFYLLCIYIIAFSSEALGFLIYPMVIFLHPFFAIPVVIGIRHHP